METAEWSPQKGDLVRVKQGFDRSFEGLAVRRAGLPLKEGALYEVLAYEHRAYNVVLVLREVRTLQIAGVRHIIELGTDPFPYSADRFEPVCKPESNLPVVRIRAR